MTQGTHNLPPLIRSLFDLYGRRIYAGLERIICSLNLTYETRDIYFENLTEIIIFLSLAFIVSDFGHALVRGSNLDQIAALPLCPPEHPDTGKSRPGDRLLALGVLAPSASQ
jgi:hypothetical protein